MKYNYVRKLKESKRQKRAQQLHRKIPNSIQCTINPNNNRYTDVVNSNESARKRGGTILQPQVNMGKKTAQSYIVNIRSEEQRDMLM